MGSRDLPDDFARAAALVDSLFAEFMRPPANLTVSQWADKNRMLSGKASSEPGPWRTDRTPYLRNIMDDLSARSTVQEVVVMFAAQLGKALDLDTPIPTPSGWVRMGDIKAGDKVFNELGEPVRVIKASEVFIGHDCYRVHFSDGASIVADADHLWTVDDERDYRKKQTVTLTTQAISTSYRHARRHRYAIAVAKPLVLPDTDLPVDPYTLGVWLGDGNSQSAQFTEHVNDAGEIIARVQVAGHTVRHVGTKGKAGLYHIDPHGVRDGLCLRGHVLAEVGVYQITKRGKPVEVCAECKRQQAMAWKYGERCDPVTRPSFHQRLTAMGVLGNKHIPLAYLRSSTTQRLELLRGLMDTDGHISPNGSNCEISSSYPQLAAGILELLYSLGYKPTSTIKHPAKGRPANRIRFTAYAETSVFHLERKRACLQPQSDRRPSETMRRRVVGVEPVPSRPTRCISVDTPSHLFLAGAAMVPTHNSETGNNWLGYIIDNEPGPVMIVQPTTDMAKRFSRQRITPMLEETPVLRRKVRENRSRDDANTTLMKDFAGGVLVVSGANSAASLRSMPVRYLFLDEIDAYPLDVDGEGDPVALAEKRTSTFARKKVLKVSTPTTKDFSRIESAYLQSNANQFHVACPHCGEHQPLEWGTNTAHGLRWAKDADGVPDLTTVHYVCKHNGCIIQEHQKSAMLPSGYWATSRESTRPGKLTGYHLNALYAPLGWVSWADLVQQFTEAAHAARQGDISKLKTFTNTVLAETWEEQGDRSNVHELMKRAPDIPLRQVHWGLFVCTMGVDTQGDRLEAYVWAWGRGLERQMVDRQVFYGDPSLPESEPGSPWAQLSTYRRTPLQHASGRTLPILATMVDSGGHDTQAVYDYARRYAHAHVYAVKGQSVRGKSVLGKPTEQDVNWRGQKVKRGVKLWPIGTDTAKAEIYGHLRIAEPGPGYVHISKHHSPEVFEQLTAERLVTRYIKGHARMEWVKPAGKRNEALDCAVYALAAAHFVGIDRWREGDWLRMELQAQGRDLFDAPLTPPPTTTSAQAAQQPLSTEQPTEQPPEPPAQQSFTTNRPSRNRTAQRPSW